LKTFTSLSPVPWELSAGVKAVTYGRMMPLSVSEKNSTSSSLSPKTIMRENVSREIFWNNKIMAFSLKIQAFHIG
jgi:hypothetical protein